MGTAYQSLDAQCAHRIWAGTEYLRCLNKVWTRPANGVVQRVQTPYCEGHARQFSAVRYSDPEYMYR